MRHELEHLALARRQPSQAVVEARGAHELAHDLGVQDRLSCRDPGQRVEELAHVRDPVLEEVAHAFRAACEQVAHEARLDVLREQQHPEPGRGLPQGQGRAQPLVGEGRGHADVDDDDVGQLAQDREPPDLRDQRVPVPDRRDHLVAAAREQRDEPVAQDDGVLGDDEPHGVPLLGRGSAWCRTAAQPAGAAVRGSGAVLGPEGRAGVRPCSAGSR
ncbi:hypothetical protein D3C74_366650 [compost metagenome]